MSGSSDPPDGEDRAKHLLADSRSWRIREGADLAWRTWDGQDFLVYDPSSGDTHLINLVTATALRRLERASLTAGELSRQVAGALRVEPGGDFEDHMARLLDHLERIGLLEPVS